MTLKALISGYYGYGNAGDEAVLAGMLRALKKHEVDPVVISGNPDETKALHGVEAIRRGDLRNIVRVLRGADVLVSGGGGLIQDSTSRRSALYYLGVIGLARALGVGAYLYAHGVGPVRTRAVKGAARLILSGVLGAGARDEASANAFEDLGVPSDRVRVTADAAFALPPVTDGESDRALRAAGVPDGGPRIGLIWRPPVLRNGRAAGAGEGEGLEKVLASALGTWVKEIGGRLVFVPMHPAFDAAPSKALARLASLEGASAHVVAGTLDFRSVRSVISALDFVVSVRYHGLLFAAASGVPCVGVAYDPKVRALAQTFGIEALPLSATKTEVRQAILRTWERRGELRTHLLKTSEELRQRALAEGARPRELLERERARTP